VLRKLAEFIALVLGSAIVALVVGLFAAGVGSSGVALLELTHAFFWVCFIVGVIGAVLVAALARFSVWYVLLAGGLTALLLGGFLYGTNTYLTRKKAELEASNHPPNITNTNAPPPQVAISKTPKPLPAKPQEPKGKIEQHGEANGAVGGSINQGPCSVAQVGGSSNQASINCEPKERHLLKEQCDTMQQELRDKQLTLTIGSLIGVDDAYGYAWEFLECFKSAGIHLEPERVMYINPNGPLFRGIEVSVHGTPPQGTTKQWIDDRTPQGTVIKALVKAHFDLDQISTGMSPSYPVGEVVVVVGKPPKQP
jgi:hypothetical protein